MSNYKEGQVNQLVNALEAAGYTKDDLTCLGQFPDHQALRGVLRGTNVIMPKLITAAVRAAVLTLVTTVTIPAVTESMDPQAEFRKSHIYLWNDFETLRNDFETRVLSVLKPISSAPEAKLTVSRLVKATNDTAIRKELREQHLAEWQDIILIIDRQKNGEVGTLLANGHANIFYMMGVDGEVFAVDVGWCADNRQWIVRAWRLDESDRWDGGDRVLSRDSQTV